MYLPSRTARYISFELSRRLWSNLGVSYTAELNLQSTAYFVLHRCLEWLGNFDRFRTSRDGLADDNRAVIWPARVTSLFSCVPHIYFIGAWKVFHWSDEVQDSEGKKRTGTWLAICCNLSCCPQRFYLREFTFRIYIRYSAFKNLLGKH